MPKFETNMRVGDAQLEAFERKRTNSRAPQASSFSSPLESSDLFSSAQESLKPSQPLIPPPTKLFPNPELTYAASTKPEAVVNGVLPISPVSPAEPDKNFLSSETKEETLSPTASEKDSEKDSSVALKPNDPAPPVSKLTLDISTTKLDDAKSIAAPKDRETMVHMSLSPQLSTSPQQTPSLGSMLIMNGQQKVHFIETQFRLFTQSFKEKVAQPLFGTETQVTRFQDAEQAVVALEQMQAFYTKLLEQISNYHRSLQQVQECESEMSRMMLEWGYKSPPESEIGSSLVTFGSAYQSQSNALVAYMKSIVTFRDQLKAFLQHALKDAQETRKKQEEARKEWDAAHLKLLPSLKLPNLESEKLVSWIPGFSSLHGTATSNQSSPHLSQETSFQNPSSPPHRSLNEDEGSLQLGQKLNDLTTGFVQKCAILQNKSASDLNQQLWTLRKHSALYHSNALDSMMSSKS